MKDGLKGKRNPSSSLIFSGRQHSSCKSLYEKGGLEALVGHVPPKN